jgi:hypothetical protein
MYKQRTNEAGYQLRYSQNGDGKISAQYKAVLPANDIEVLSSTAVNDGQWHFIVATYNRTGNLSIYVDGVLSNTTSMAATASEQILPLDPITLGTNIYSAGTAFNNYFTGWIDDFNPERNSKFIQSYLWPILLVSQPIKRYLQ